MENQEFYQEHSQGDAAGTETIRQAKKTFSRMGWGILTFFAASSVVQILLMALLPQWSAQGIGFWISTFAPIYLVGLPLGALVLGKKPPQKIEPKPMKAGRYAEFFLMALFIMGAGNLVGSVILMILNAITGSSMANPVTEMIMGQNLLYVLLTAVIVGPLVEEFVFRKLLIDRMFPYGEKTAILVSALLFGLFHGNLSQFFYAFALGILLGYVYVRTDSMGRTLGIHMTLNFLCGFLPVLIMQGLDLEFLENLTLESLQDLQSLGTEQMMLTLQWIFAYVAYAIVIFGLEIAGLVIFCKRFKKAQFAPAHLPIPKERRFAVVFGNVGMILLMIAFAVVFVMSLIP